MAKRITILVLSDVHYASPAEKARGCPELDVIANPLLRLGVRAYRTFIWRKDPFAHNHHLDHFFERKPPADLIVANGDYSCDTAFIGVSDPAAFESAHECITKLRQQFGENLRLTFGDHELGKMSLFGGCGGLRLKSFEVAQTGLKLDPFWEVSIGQYRLIGITSSLVAFPVYEPESLPEERSQWEEHRTAHLSQLRATFQHLKAGEKVLLFCHDPTALPFLHQDPVIGPKLDQIERTIIGHLHSNLLLTQSRCLSGLPTIRFLGNSIRRMSAALQQARYWNDFKPLLCPALGGIELLKDGGFFQLQIDPDGKHPLVTQFHPLP